MSRSHGGRLLVLSLFVLPAEASRWEEEGPGLCQIPAGSGDRITHSLLQNYVDRAREPVVRPADHAFEADRAGHGSHENGGLAHRAIRVAPYARLGVGVDTAYFRFLDSASLVRLSVPGTHGGVSALCSFVVFAVVFFCVDCCCGIRKKAGSEQSVGSEPPAPTSLQAEETRYGGTFAFVASALDQFFGISSRGSTILTEIRAGLTAWMSMAYILIVNPTILTNTGEPGPKSREAILTATAFSACFSSVSVGIFGNAPFGIHAGMGLNSYVALTVFSQMRLSWPQALSCCFVSGLLLLLVAVSDLGARMAKVMLSNHMKSAITAGIGLLQAMIGFRVMGLILPSEETMVQLTDFSPPNPALYLALAGVIFVAVAMAIFKVSGTLLFCMLAMTGSSWIGHLVEMPTTPLSWPSTDYFLVIDMAGWAEPSSPDFPKLLLATAVLFIVALFDVMGVQFGLASAGGLLTANGEVPHSREILVTSGLGTMVAACLGCSPVIIANESFAAIAEGGRTGLAAVTIGICFGVSTFFAPVVCAMPVEAQGVPLIFVGALMMTACSRIDMLDLRQCFPAFFCISMMPFTYSVHNGIIAGILLDNIFSLVVWLRSALA